MEIICNTARKILILIMLHCYKIGLSKLKKKICFRFIKYSYINIMVKPYSKK